MSYDICHVSCVICHVSYVICHLSFVICHLSYVICHMSFVICHMSFIICHLSFVICHLSYVIYHSHMSYVIFFFISELCTFLRLFTYTHATITIQSVCFISGRSSMLYLLYCMLLAHCVLALRRGAHCRVHSYHALEGSRGSVYRDHVFARWRGTCKPLKGRSSKIRVGS